MKEFIEKLIGRLEEQKTRYKEIRKNTYCRRTEMDDCDSCRADHYLDARLEGINKAKEIAKELAEEHKDNVMINGQYCWQTCGATEHCKECNRLCNGSIDYYENYDVLAEEHSGGWIPCSERLPDKSGKYIVTQERYSIDDRFHSGKKWIEVDYVEFNAMDKKWSRANFFNVIAWQPLPPAFKPKGE